MHVAFSTYQHQSLEIDEVNEGTRLIITLDTGAMVVARLTKWPIGDISFFIDREETDVAVLEAIYADHYDNFFDRLNVTWFRISLPLIIWSQTLTEVLGRAHARRYERIMHTIRDSSTIELLSNTRTDHDTFGIGGHLCVLPKVNSQGRSMLIPNLIKSVHVE